MFDESREKVANFINSNFEEIVFTSGATNSINLVAYGLIDYFNNQNILFIEWAENIKNILPNKTKNLFFEVIKSNQRLIKYYE